VGKRDDALALLRNGLDPVEISERQGVSLTTILAYLNEMIGAGKLRRLDVLFSMRRERRSKPPTKDYQVVVQMYGSAAHALGDMYEGLRRVEIKLHDGIRRALQEEYGNDESGWWRTGVPVVLRQKLQTRREEDSDPVEPYAYTDLLDLAEILDKQWAKIALKVIAGPSQKKETLAEFRRLNQIRRKVMHPVRSNPANDEAFEDEFKFVCSFAQKVAPAPASPIAKLVRGAD
jgi:hypothetical protein